MTQSIELPWGDNTLRLELPSSWRIMGELRPAPMPPAEDAADACREGLNDPIQARSLLERDLTNRKILIISDDHSRPTPVAEFIYPVIEQLIRAGVRESDIEILIATGVHRKSRLEEIEKKLGKDVVNRFSWRCHNAYDETELVELGVTSRGTKIILNRKIQSADLIILLGAVEPHLLLGFGGGLKMIIPGCAGAETIGRNHMQGVDPDHFDFVGQPSEESPMRLDLEEGAGLAGKEFFMVNAIMNEFGRPTKFFCGDPIQAHRAATEYISKLVGLDVPEQADVVITNSFPMESDLRQSIKCVGNTLYAAKPGGVMMGMLRCIDGLGEIPLAKKTLPYPVMRGLLTVIGKKRILPLVEKVKKGEPVEEKFIGHFGLQMLRRNHLALFSDSPLLPENVGRKVGMAVSFSKVQSMVAWAAAKSPSQPSVWIFPYGGSTYAINRNG